MKRALLLAAAALVAAPAAAQTVAITGGTRRDRRRLRADPRTAPSCIRDGRIVAAGAGVAVPGGRDT